MLKISLKLIVSKQSTCPRKMNYAERKTKSLFMIYANFGSILVPEDNVKQNPNEPYTEKYQKHVTCSYGYKLVCVDNKFSKPFKSCLGEDYNFTTLLVL